MSFDYNSFTKAELVSFLNKYGDDFKYTHKPYSIMLNERQDRVFDELDKLSKENDRLLAKLNNSIDEDKFKIVSYLQGNYEKWDKLHKQLDKYSKLLEVRE